MHGFPGIAQTLEMLAQLIQYVFYFSLKKDEHVAIVAEINMAVFAFEQFLDDVGDDMRAQAVAAFVFMQGEININAPPATLPSANRPGFIE
jgi:hypothetical protein